LQLARSDGRRLQYWDLADMPESCLDDGADRLRNLAPKEMPA
jgi:hypothetical protein